MRHLFPALLLSFLLSSGISGSRLMAEIPSLSEPDSALLNTLNSDARSYYGNDLIKMDSAGNVYLDKALQLQQPEHIVIARNLIGTANLEMGNYGKALHHFLEGLAIADSFQLERRRTLLINNIATTYHVDEQYSLALAYYQKALPGFNHPSLIGRKGQALYNIAIILQDIGQADSARKYYLEGIHVAEEQQDTLSLADLYNSLGILYQEKGQRKKAIHSLNLALSYAQAGDDLGRSFYPLLNLGNIELEADRPDLARPFLLEAYQIALSIGSMDMQIDIQEAMSELEMASGNPAKALMHRNSWGDLIQEQHDAEQESQFELLQAKFRAREQEIELRANQVVITEQSRRLTLQNQLTVALVALISLLGLLAIGFWRIGVIRTRHTKTLIRLNEEKDNMLHAVAHDLQSPMVNIRGLVNIMKQGSQDRPEHAQMLNMVDSELNRSGHLVRSLLDLESIESGEISLELEPVKVNQIVKKISSEYQRIALKKDISIRTSLQNQEIILNSDQSFLQRILDNLVSNAVKFSPVGSEIRISVEQPGEEVMIRVSDDGPGFTKQDKSRLFGRFQRLSAKPTGDEHSTGLGLAITKALVDRLRGSIQVSSFPGKGAEFVVSLPS